MPGLMEVQEFARRLEEGQPVFRFQSADHLATILPALLAGVRSDLGLAEAVAPVQAPARSEVFVSYAHLDDRDDRPWLQKLLPSLKALQNPPHGIPYWYDEGIQPGERWEAEIFKHIDSARLAIL